MQKKLSAVTLQLYFCVAATVFLLLWLPLSLLFAESFSIVVGSILLSLLFLGVGLRQRDLNCLSIFMMSYTMFFLLRFLYMVLKKDYGLLSDLFKVNVSEGIVYGAFTVSATSLAFLYYGYLCCKMCELLRSRSRGKGEAERPRILMRRRLIALDAFVLVLVQFLSVLFVLILARGGRAVYESGGYVYDLPVLAQGFGLASCLFVSFVPSFPYQKIAVSISFICLFSVLWATREIVIFRASWLTPALCVAIAFWKYRFGRLKPIFVFSGLILGLPFFTLLGRLRGSSNAEIIESGEGNANRLDLLESFSGSGDLNIFDSFVAVYGFQPSFYSYANIWLYTPVHWVPRSFWKSKPELSDFIDTSWAMGAPYTPGLPGNFLLHGGVWWLYVCMFSVGVILRCLDLFVESRVDFFRSSLYAGILVGNLLFLPRYQIYMATYQTLYFFVPGMILCLFYLKKKRVVSVKGARNIL